jgi:hypothetical protein
VGIHQVTAGVTFDDYFEFAMELADKLGGLVKIIDHNVWPVVWRT